MNNTLVKCNLLLFSLQKKIEKLELIREYTICQGTEIKLTDKAEITKLKQDLIEQIPALDRGFERVLAEIMPYLQSNSDKYADIIFQMKKKINRIEELAEEIQQLEKKNYSKKIIPPKQEKIQPKIKISKQKALGEYKKTKKKNN